MFYWGPGIGGQPKRQLIASVSSREVFEYDCTFIAKRMYPIFEEIKHVKLRVFVHLTYGG